jgi:hypothetical protein
VVAASLKGGNACEMVLRWTFPPQSVGYRSVRRTVDDPNRLARWKAGEPLAEVGIKDYLDSI